MKNSSGKRFVVCVRNEGYEASLELRKLYELLPDSSSERHHLIRVIDESGEDYLYPEGYFIPVELPKATEKALLSVA